MKEIVNMSGSQAVVGDTMRRLQSVEDVVIDKRMRWYAILYILIGIVHVRHARVKLIFY